jgi:hypothetical protein
MMSVGLPVLGGSGMAPGQMGFPNGGVDPLSGGGTGMAPGQRDFPNGGVVPLGEEVVL